MNKFTISAIAFGVFSASTLAMAQSPVSPSMKAGAAQPMPTADRNAQMAQMDFRMNEMQAMHEKMMNATTPEQRRLVMEEQRKVMRESMGAMNQMMPSREMMAGKSGGMMGGKTDDKPADKGMGGDMNAQMPMMQEHMDMIIVKKRTDMMQMMMQAMMDQQGMMGGPKGPDAVSKN